MDNYHVYDQGFDFGSFINFPEDNNMESNNMDFQFPTEDVSADLSFSDMQLIPDMDFSQYDATLNAFDTFEYPASSVNESPLTTNYESFAPQAEDFRFLVDSWASTDQRSRSMKQKRRDAAIDLHLQRFANAHSDSQLFPTDSEFSFSDSPSNSFSQSSQQSPVASTPVSSTSNSERSVPQTGGRELKQSAKVAMDAKRKRKAALSKVAMPTPGLVTTSPSETPSTISRSSFSPSVFSQVDSQSFNEEIDYALASLDETNDMERWANLVSHTSMADPPQQYYQTESHDLSPVRHRNINSADVSTNLQTNVGYLPQQDESFDHLLGLRDGISDGGSRNTGGLVTTGGLAGLTEGTSGLMWNISSGRSGVQTTGLTGLANAPGQVSTPTQQVLPTASPLVHPGTSPRRRGETPTLAQNISPVLLGSPKSSTMVLPNTQQQPSTPVPQVLPTSSSLVPPAASLGRPVRQGLPLEIVVPASDVARQTAPASSLPPLSSVAANVPWRLPVVAPSPVASVLSTRQETLAPSLVALSAVLASGLLTMFGELQASNLTSAMFKDAQQTVYWAIQQFSRVSTAFMSTVYWMSELCVMALQGMHQVAMLFQSTLFNFTEQFRQRSSVTKTCASVLSTSLSIGSPVALHV
ncbi:hypothetical protein EIK77_000664 [Talaromyces pinophilus]|nr:hypothetical protein EIK77_000664 [Talaromyces pinophilus]